MIDGSAVGRKGTRAFVLAFLVAAVTLAVQILLHRIVSAKLLNNYAFFVISLTMLGFAFSGVILSRFLRRVLEAWPDALTACAAAFALTTVGVSVLFYQVDAGSQFRPGLAAFLSEALRWLPVALLFTVPFTFCGLMLGMLLADPELPTSRVYGFDLAGSAVGAFAIVPAIRGFGVETSLLVACAALLLGTTALAPPRRQATRALALLAVVAIGLGLAKRDQVFSMRPRAGSMLALGETLGEPFGIEYQQWDPVARIEVTRIPPPDPKVMDYPSLIGDNPELLERFRRALTQNDFAFTYMVDWDGRIESLAGIERTIYAAAYEASSVPAPRALVIGVGGGFDILTALRYRASAVTGVEINEATLDVVRNVYRDYCGSWSRHPQVRLVADEGRHFLSTHADRYDILQLSGVDSYSGTPGAAHVFSESYLYTEEAFDLYLSRLTDSGILNVMRLEHRFPREMLRALVTAVGSLRRAGAASPADHIVMLSARNGSFTALLVKRTPFLPDEIARVSAWANSNPFLTVSAAPGRNLFRENAYQHFLDLQDARRERAFVEVYRFDISPATDDRPFFFKHSFWSHLFAADPQLRATVPVMELSLLLLAGAIGLTALVCVWLPLRLVVGNAAAVRGRARFGLFFAAIGLGYFALEIALLQRFGLFLGHPNYALSVVLAALLVATGAGALASEQILRRLREIRYVAYALGIVVLIERLAVLPLLPSLDGLAFGARVGLVAALVLPVGLLLGVFLPQGVERLKQQAPALVPWAWGINGIFSVLAPVLAIAFSVTWGMDLLLLCSLPIYLAAGWLLPPSAAPSASQASPS